MIAKLKVALVLICIHLPQWQISYNTVTFINFGLDVRKQTVLNTAQLSVVQIKLHKFSNSG